MAKHIEKEAALGSLCAACEVVPIEAKELCPHRLTGCQEYANIFVLPAADLVEVVRCRECIYAPSGPESGGFALEWPHDEWPEDNPCPCKCEDGWYSQKPKPDFYCASGKRKDGGQE